MNKEIIKKLQDKIGIEDISDKELLKKYRRGKNTAQVQLKNYFWL